MQSPYHLRVFHRSRESGTPQFIFDKVYVGKRKAKSPDGRLNRQSGIAEIEDTFRNPHGDAVQDKLELARSTEEEKQNQLKRLDDSHRLHAAESPAMLIISGAGKIRQ